jgi:hypothetical protein
MPQAGKLGGIPIPEGAAGENLPKNEREAWAAAGLKDILLKWSINSEVVNGYKKKIHSGVQA